MSTRPISSVFGDPAAILDRHDIRRMGGVPTVSLLLGPIGAGARIWRCWAASTGRSVVIANCNVFPLVEWIRSVAEQVDLSTLAIQSLAQRAGRDPDEFLIAWSAKTPGDRERFWNTITPSPEDEVLRVATNVIADQASGSTLGTALSKLGEPIVPMICHLAPSVTWPSVLFLARSAADFSTSGPMTANWAALVPAVPFAVGVSAEVWEQFRTTAPESRAKALLKEGELRVPLIDAKTVQRTLSEAGAGGNAAAALAATGADAVLLDAAVGALRANAVPPTTEVEEDRARSAAERFLFTFLESLPETMGRFELNAALDFRFGPRWAEVDLLCRSPRIAIELDGYFHFRAPDGYRRDRAKDWELQRRGYLVLRFLAEDVIPNIELIRDRILDALTITPFGAPP